METFQYQGRGPADGASLHHGTCNMNNCKCSSWMCHIGMQKTSIPKYFMYSSLECRNVHLVSTSSWSFGHLVSWNSFDFSISGHHGLMPIVSTHVAGHPHPCERWQMFDRHPLQRGILISQPRLEKKGISPGRPGNARDFT